MGVRYWYLPETIVVAIKAPDFILHALSKSIVLNLQHHSRFARIVRLEWSADRYRQYQLEYWKEHYLQEDVVWRETESGWLFLGMGYFLAYSKTTDSSVFFTSPELEDSLLTYSYPFLNLLVNLLKPYGYVSLHAAVIGQNNKFVLVPGKQNTGKSTTSATWVLKGGNFLTDDFCFVHVENPAIAHGFYPSVRLREGALPLLDGILPPNALQQKGDSKYFFSLLVNAPHLFVSSAAISSVFCLNIQKRSPSHAVVSPKIGLEYLASSVAFSVQYRGDSRLCLQTIKKLIHQLPVLQVNLSPDVNENYEYLNELIAQY